MNEYFNAVKANEMITIFASLLHERRIIVTSSRLSRLTACVQAQYTYLDSNVGSGLTSAAKPDPFLLVEPNYGPKMWVELVRVGPQD